METFAKETLPVSLEAEMRHSYLDYAMSVIVGRALPDVRDGLKPEGKAAIDSEIISKLPGVQKLELVLVTGHTDRIGTQAYNQKLSERRADAVRDYLVSKGVAKDKIETLGMGKTQPLPGVSCDQKAMKELIACLAPNRRVEVEVKGEAVRR